MEDDRTEPAGNRPWATLGVAATAVFMAFLDVTVVNIVFPDLRRSFDEDSLADLSWVLNAYNVVFAALLVPGGRLADRFGRRRTYLFGLWTFVAASALAAVAPTAWTLVAARVLQAAGAAIMIPTSLALVLPKFPASMRATATGLWGGSAGVAAAAGPSLGGVLAEVADWRWVFILNVPVGLATIVATHRIVRRDEAVGGTAIPDPIGTMQLAIGTAALALGIVKGPDWSWGDTRILVSFTAATVLLALFVRRCLREPEPVIEPALFRVRSFATANVATFVFSSAFYAVLLSVVLFMTGVWKYSFLEAGFALTVAPATAAITAGLGGRLADRFGAWPVAAPGAAIFAVGCVLYAVMLEPEPDFLGAYAPAAILTGGGVGLTFASLTSAAVTDLPESRFATGTAVVSTTRQLGAVLGVSALIAILQAADPGDALHAYDIAWTMMAAAGVAAAVVGLAALIRGLGREARAPLERRVRA